MEEEINWCNPPKKPISKPKSFVERLKERPQTWALWREKVPTAHSMGGSLEKYYPGVKATYRSAGKNDKGLYLYDIYVMWDPENEEA